MNNQHNDTFAPTTLTLTGNACGCVTSKGTPCKMPAGQCRHHASEEADRAMYDGVRAVYAVTAEPGDVPFYGFAGDVPIDMGDGSTLASEDERLVERRARAERRNKAKLARKRAQHVKATQTSMAHAIKRDIRPPRGADKRGAILASELYD